MATSKTLSNKFSYSMPFGISKNTDSSYKFNLWAPDAEKIYLCLFDKDSACKEIPMKKINDGWFTLTTDKARPGNLYKYKLDNGLMVPDPVSRFQPEDVHGPSQIIEPETFDWGSTANWKGKPWTDSVIYELHTGTFTKEGTFQAIKNKLDYLIDLGITAIELLPVADFPGKWNWGYDGVLLYAPDNVYGKPEDLKDLIKTCHQKGIMVFLDVVYNHFGPEGNYLYCYAKSKFFSSKHKTPWGDAINFNNQTVRDFFIHNAIFWLTEYQFDGLRLDAIHAIKDDSSPDIVEELASRVRASIPAERHVHLILENDGNESRYHQQKDGRAILCDGQWNDDFHHFLHIQLTGEKDGYYADYTRENTSKETAWFAGKAITEGFAYQGEVSKYRNNQKRGENSKNLNPYTFINFMQNHDMVGNRAFGDRIDKTCPPDALKAGITLFLLTPSIPMLFMGEEWKSKSPFLFFCDFGEDLADSVRDGRREEFSKFPEFSDPQTRNTIPDPLSKVTFENSKLNWEEVNVKEHKEIINLYKSLLKIRKQYIVPLLTKVKGDYASFKTLSDQALYAEWTIKEDNKTLKLISNLSCKSIPFKEKWPENLIASNATKPIDSMKNSKEIAPWSVCWFLDNNQ